MSRRVVQSALFVRDNRLAVFLSDRALAWLGKRMNEEREAGGRVRSIGCMGALVIESAAAAAEERAKRGGK